MNFVLAESALELVPKEIRGKPAIASDSKRRGKPAEGILLDRSFHHSAMTNLRDSEKRGRPDLVHMAILSVAGTPLYLEGRAKIFVHTYPGIVLEIREKTRIPKNYIRFRGLMEEVLSGKSEAELITPQSKEMKDLVRNITADRIFGLSVQGKQSNAEELALRMAEARNPVIVVGGFPHGHFTKGTLELLDDLVRIDPRPLEAHVVASRVIYEAEKSGKSAND